MVEFYAEHFQSYEWYWVTVSPTFSSFIFTLVQNVVEQILFKTLGARFKMELTLNVVHIPNLTNHTKNSFRFEWKKSKNNFQKKVITCITYYMQSDHSPVIFSFTLIANNKLPCRGSTCMQWQFHNIFQRRQSSISNVQMKKE